jgi:hypothetical protein
MAIERGNARCLPDSPGNAKRLHSTDNQEKENVLEISIQVSIHLLRSMVLSSGRVVKFR